MFSTSPGYFARVSSTPLHHPVHSVYTGGCASVIQLGGTPLHQHLGDLGRGGLEKIGDVSHVDTSTGTTRRQVRCLAATHREHHGC